MQKDAWVKNKQRATNSKIQSKPARENEGSEKGPTTPEYAQLIDQISSEGILSCETCPGSFGAGASGPCAGLTLRHHIRLTRHQRSILRVASLLYISFFSWIFMFTELYHNAAVTVDICNVSLLL